MIVVRHKYIAGRGPRARGGKVVAIGRALQHVKYIQHRPGRDREPGGREMFDEREDSIDAREMRKAIKELGGSRVIVHKLTLAPEINPADKKAFTREVMINLSQEKGRDLRWFAVEHGNTEHPHIHVVVLGRDKHGTEVQISLKDIEKVKEYGDRFLERHHPREFERARQGELLIKEFGIEGGLIYSFSKRLRDFIGANGEATVMLDLLPGRTKERVVKDLSRPRGSRSLSRHLQNCLGNDALKRALLYERVERKTFDEPQALAKFIKALPLTLKSPRPIAEAISSAGGVSFSSLNEHLMLKKLPGTFVAGEMIDWEAPTGGYLLTACLASGRWAANGVIEWLGQKR